MFLILQAFKPPVSSPPVLLSSSTRSSNVLLRILQYPSIRGIKISRLTARPPPSQKSLQSSQHWVFPPVLGVDFQRPLSHSVRWGSIFSDPYRILCFGVSKTYGKVLRCDFYAILPLMLAILPVLVAILAPTCPTSALKMPEKCHLGAKVAKQTLQPPF